MVKDAKTGVFNLRSNLFASALPPLGGNLQMENLGLPGNEVCAQIGGCIVSFLNAGNKI